jgi:hypothetical protein
MRAAELVRYLAANRHIVSLWLANVELYDTRMPSDMAVLGLYHTELTHFHMEDCATGFSLFTCLSRTTSAASLVSLHIHINCLRMLVDLAHMLRHPHSRLQDLTLKLCMIRELEPRANSRERHPVATVDTKPANIYFAQHSAPRLEHSAARQWKHSPSSSASRTPCAAPRPRAEAATRLDR